ncbi:phosphatase PAP2 family protein [Sulfuriferula thiophila]|uniref:phosphatase PAP2 family protein n=1 Tax=Sulfuriferula thiophila TaxID=1781211 RepID=UPI000F6100AE|nr:phosphatase PAP2 family protein [Sulfuriferula thiophila]
MSKSTESCVWYRQMATALSSHILLKAIGTPLFIAIFFGAYLFLLKHPAYAMTVMPFTALDRMVSFQPSAMPLYVSLWVYVSLPPSLLTVRREMFLYGTAMAATCVIGLLVFYFWPTAVPVAQIDWALYPSVDYLKSIDATGNAFPSLHVATASFSAIWLNFILRRFSAPRWLLAINWAWCAGILYSTLATRQHVIVDVIAGLILGVLVAYISLRRRAVQTTSSTMND